jgi:glycerol kinase
MNKPYLLSLDQGTTSSRAILFDREQNIVEIAQKEFTQLYPKPGWVEHDPMEIYSSQYSVLVEVLAKSGVRPEEVAAIGITNQRETTIIWDKATGRPIHNAIVWQCRLTAGLAALRPTACRVYPREHRSCDRRLFFRSKIPWIPMRSRCTGTSRAGRAALWHGGSCSSGS